MTSEGREFVYYGVTRRGWNLRFNEHTRDAVMVERIERLDALLDGRRQPETLQDRLDIARAERERAAVPFDPAFWLARASELMGAGFTAQQATALVQSVRERVEPAVTHTPEFEEQTA